MGPIGESKKIFSITGRVYLIEAGRPADGEEGHEDDDFHIDDWSGT